MTHKIPHFIDGRRSELSSTRTADVLNPSTGEVQAQVLLASKADVDAAVLSAADLSVALGAAGTSPNEWSVGLAGDDVRDAALAHADAWVHNGGFGAVCHGLAHGVPQVVAGEGMDKGENAARVARSG